LITGSYRDITDAAIDPNSGGTFLLSLRDSPTPPPSEKKRMAQLPADEAEKVKWEAKYQGAKNTLKELFLDVLVVLGGNGTIAATVDFADRIESELDVSTKIICLPRTIDNDINTHTRHTLSDGNEVETALCPGYPSAAEKLVRAARRLRTTATSTKRIFTLETMGRDAGWLALAATLGWAEVVIVPEVRAVTDPGITDATDQRSFDKDTNDNFCRIVFDWYAKNRSVIVSVSEGTLPKPTDIYGPRKLIGAGDQVCAILKSYLEDEKNTDHLEETGVIRKVFPNKIDDENCAITEVPEVRCQHTDYDPRMGAPSSYDIELARVLAYEKLKAMLRDGEFGRLPVLGSVLWEHELKDAGVNEAKTVEMRKATQMLLPENPYYDKERLTSSKAFDDFLRRLVGEGLIE